jgi:hypothetical protein
MRALGVEPRPPYPKGRELEDLAQHRQRLADGVPVAAKGADDVREDCCVIAPGTPYSALAGTMKAASRRRSRASAGVSSAPGSSTALIAPRPW